MSLLKNRVTISSWMSQLQELDLSLDLYHIVKTIFLSIDLNLGKKLDNSRSRSNSAAEGWARLTQFPSNVESADQILSRF